MRQLPSRQLTWRAAVGPAAGEVFTLAGVGSAGFRDGPPMVARFYYPAGVAVSPDGVFVYVADTWNSRVRRCASPRTV
jgi:sugar lactone lactonase YvrE